jgi:hypothetical protein
MEDDCDGKRNTRARVFWYRIGTGSIHTRRGGTVGRWVATHRDNDVDIIDTTSNRRPPHIDLSSQIHLRMPEGAMSSKLIVLKTFNVVVKQYVGRPFPHRLNCPLAARWSNGRRGSGPEKRL